MHSVIVPANQFKEKVANLSNIWQDKTELVAPPTEEGCKKQATWTKMQAAQKVESILQNADVITRSRWLAASSMESGAWLSALPAAALGNLLDDSSLRIAVGLRLGAVICTEHLCVCGKAGQVWSPRIVLQEKPRTTRATQLFEHCGAPYVQQ